MNSYNRGFGIIIALAFIFLVLISISGCLSFGGGPNEPMLERGERICADTGGEWIDYRCVYPAWQMVDTTTSVLGVQTDG